MSEEIKETILPKSTNSGAPVKATKSISKILPDNPEETIAKLRAELESLKATSVTKPKEEVIEIVIPKLSRKEMIDKRMRITREDVQRWADEKYAYYNELIDVEIYIVDNQNFPEIEFTYQGESKKLKHNGKYKLPRKMALHLSMNCYKIKYRNAGNIHYQNQGSAMHGSTGALNTSFGNVTPQVDDIYGNRLAPKARKYHMAEKEHRFIIKSSQLDMNAYDNDTVYIEAV